MSVAYNLGSVQEQLVDAKTGVCVTSSFYIHLYIAEIAGRYFRVAGIIRIMQFDASTTRKD